MKEKGGWGRELVRGGEQMRGKGVGEQYKYKDEGSNQERKRVRRERMKGGSE